MPKIIIWPYFKLCSFTFQTFASIPLIRLHSNTKYFICWKLLLSQICRLSQLIIFSIYKVIKIRFNKFSWRKVISVGLWSHDLFDLIMNNVFLNFSKPKITRIDIPVVLSFFLFSWIIVTMWFQVHLFNFLLFEHIYPWVNCLFCSKLIFLALKAKLKLLLFCLIRQVVISVNSFSQWLSKNYIIITVLRIYTCSPRDRLQTG